MLINKDLLYRYLQIIRHFSFSFPNFIVILQPKRMYWTDVRKPYKKSIMQIAINPNVYIPAQTFAQQQGLNLTSVIENFLIRFVRENKQAVEQPVPDVVLSLLGAGEPVAEDDLNGREAYATQC